MDILISLLRVLVLLFLVYTVVFVVQWVFSFCLSIYRMADFKMQRIISREIFDNEMAQRNPVSILIPAYNEASCICDTIDSLLREDYPNLEIIVIDDGSTDDTEEKVTKKYKMQEADISYQEKIAAEPIRKCYEKVVNGRTLKFVCKNNGGKSDALNCGLNLCSSSYSLILDADTKVQKGAVRNMRLQFLLDDELIVCAGVVGNGMYQNAVYKKLSFWQKALVLFQQLEYFRTFYMQRELR